MNQPRFLTAEWKYLLMLSYAVDRSLLEPFVPSGTELDTFEGDTYISLIGFEFNQTRVRGVAVPFHRSFEEINVRFYVRRAEKRGVVFIRELVPKRAVTFVARRVFHEKYAWAPMSHRIEHIGAGIKAEYSWGLPAQRCGMRIETQGASFLPVEGSAPQFITEHYWGYAAQPDGGCLEYAVQHPQWKVWSAKHAELTGDTASYYGPRIAAALQGTPQSAFLAEGSPVSVFQGVRI